MFKKINKKLKLYVFQHFAIVKNFSELDDFIEYFFERIVYALLDDEIVGFAVYLWVNDEALRFIKEKKINFANFEDFKRIEKMNGDNIHFFGMATQYPDLIRKGIKQIMKDKKPKTISWLNQDMTKFCCFKGVQ